MPKLWHAGSPTYLQLELTGTLPRTQSDSGKGGTHGRRKLLAQNQTLLYSILYTAVITRRKKQALRIPFSAHNALQGKMIIIDPASIQACTRGATRLKHKPVRIPYSPQRAAQCTMHNAQQNHVSDVISPHRSGCPPTVRPRWSATLPGVSRGAVLATSCSTGLLGLRGAVRTVGPTRPPVGKLSGWQERAWSAGHLHGYS